METELQDLIIKWRKEVESLKVQMTNKNLIQRVRCDFNIQIVRLLLCIDEVEKILK
jgi:hypothetical protein